MEVSIDPGSFRGGSVSVPGDKSIAHRWVMFAATASGSSRLDGLPDGQDVRSTVSCMGSLRGDAALSTWAQRPAGVLTVLGAGWGGLRPTGADLSCANSGTTMRLLSGILAARPFRSVLTGDSSLSSRPMERVAEPLRRMGARISTSDGHAPVVIDGGDLVGIEWRAQTPSAQVKSAVLLAGLSAQGDTTVVESAPTRDHTERILRALAAPLDASRDRVSIRSFQHEGFAATVPGDPSSAAFLLVAAGLTGSPVTIEGVCLNETRTRFVEVLRRMGMSVDVQESEQVMGEPVGSLVSSGRIQEGVSVARDEAPLLIDEIPALALAGAHAGHPSSFEGLGELRVKESDRLAGMCDGIRGLGGEATVEDDTLLVAGTGLSGGVADSRGDHRMAMAFAVGALAAGSRCRILGMEATAVSFPSFLRTLRDLGSEVT